MADETPAPGPRRQRRRVKASIEVLPSGSVRVRVRGVTADGRKYDRSETVTAGETARERKLEAQRTRDALVKWALDLESGAGTLEERLTLAEWCARFRRSGKKWGVKDGHIWNRQLRPLWSLTLQSLDESAVEAWALKLARTYKPSTVKKAAGLLSRIVRAALAAHVIARMPWVTMRGVPKPSECGSRDAPSRADVLAICEAAKAIDAERGGGDLHLRLWFQMQTGGRSIECAWASPDDLSDTPRGPEVMIRAAKKGSDHAVGIPRELADALRAHFAALPPRAQALGVLFPIRGARARWGKRWAEVRSKNGTVYREAKSWVTWREAAELRKRSGVASWDPYSMRHFRFQSLADAGLSEKQLQRAGGWKSTKMTGTYVNSDAVELPDTAAASLLPVLPSVPPALSVIDGGKSERPLPAGVGTPGPSTLSPWADKTGARSGTSAPPVPSPDHGEGAPRRGRGVDALAGELLALARTGALGPNRERALALALSLMGEGAEVGAPVSEAKNGVKKARKACDSEHLFAKVADNG